MKIPRRQAYTGPQSSPSSRSRMRRSDPRPRADLHLLQAGALLAGLLCATGVIAYLLWLARVDALETARTTALNYARTLEVRMDASLRRADSVLQTMIATTPVAALEPGATPAFETRVNAQLETLRHGFDEVIALRLVDREGTQRYAVPSAMAGPVNYADRSFFRSYQQDLGAGLLFSEVFTGRLAQRPVMVISRPLRAEDGSLLGAALIPLDLTHFERHFRQLDIGPHGAVFLRRSDREGALVLRWPHADLEINRPTPASNPVWQSVAAGQRESIHAVVSPVDGVRRLAGTVRLQNYPFYLSVALSEEDVLAPWRRLALSTGVIWAATVALVLGLTWRLWRSDASRSRLESRLREAERMESLGTLAGGIAHDFNNIMAAILGNVAMARGELVASHPAQQRLAQIHRAGMRARDLVQQILAFSRRQTPVLASQPLQPVIEETLALLQATLPPDITVQRELPAAAVHAAVDATRLQQVLMNLCTNACHAMEGRPGTLTVGLAAEPLPPPDGENLPAAPVAHLWVRDTGEGMSPETLARVFEPFYTTKAAGRGTGLGLSVVHGIISAHQGHIRIDSAPGQGTTVHIHLPLSATPAAAAEPSRDAGDTLPLLSTHCARVLYVDDDEVVGLMAERLLTLAGHQVTLLNDGRAALAAVDADPDGFDLVITDHNMPGLSGLDVARALREHHPALPVVVSSGYISDELQREAQRLGVRRILAKERSAEELPLVVEDVLEL